MFLLIICIYLVNLCIFIFRNSILQKLIFAISQILVFIIYFKWCWCQTSYFFSLIWLFIIGFKLNRFIIMTRRIYLLIAFLFLKHGLRGKLIFISSMFHFYILIFWYNFNYFIFGKGHIDFDELYDCLHNNQSQLLIF